MKRLLLLIGFAITLVSSYATHIVGGVIYYECLGGNQYKIIIIKYRDGNSGVTGGYGNNLGFDIRRLSNHQLVYSGNAQRVTRIYNLPLPSTNPCLLVPPTGSETDYYRYEATVTLPGGGSLYIATSSSDRNNTENLVNRPGQTLYSEIPDPAAYPCNSAPNLDIDPPIAVCVNQPISFSYGVTDPDGDVLTYSLCAALDDNGSNQGPFSSVPYDNPYSAAYPVQSSPPFSINPTTGVVSGTPTLNGRFVITVCINEWRNGVQIGQYRSEVQINVTTCNTPVTAGIDTHYTSVSLGGIPILASCDDYTVNFNNKSNGGSTFFWDFGVPGITTDTSSQFAPSYTYPDTGTYSAKLVINKGFPCVDSVIRTVIVYPTIYANFSNSTPVCPDEPLLFSDQASISHGYATSWIWDFGNGSTSTLQNPTGVKYPTAGNYNVRFEVETSKGCRDTTYKQITVFDNPQVNAGNPKTICKGDSALLNGLVSPSGSTVSWQPTIGLECPTCLQTKASPLTTTEYTLTVTSPEGCTSHDSVLVTIAPDPIVDAGPDQILCQPGFAALHGSVSNANPGYTVNWSPPANLLPSPTILNPTAQVTNNQTFVLSITTTLGCVVTDTMMVIIDPFIISTIPDTAICSGESIELNIVQGPPNLNYTWQPAGSLSDPFISSPLASPTTTTTYTVTGVDPASGCMSSDQITLTVNPIPPVDAGLDQTICESDTANLQAAGASSYSWDPDPTLNCINCPDPTASPQQTRKYYVSGTDALGCTNRDSIEVTVMPLPSITMSPASPAVACQGGTIQLMASGGSSYSWSPSGSLSCSSCPDPVASPINNTTYSVTVTDNNGCINMDSIQVDIGIGPVVSITPTMPSICVGDTVQITASGGVSYSWMPITGLSNPLSSSLRAFPSTSTTYTVSVTDVYGCISEDTITVNVKQAIPGTFSRDTSVCVGDSVGINAGGYSQYTWYPSTSLSCTNCPNPISFPISTTEYTVHVEDANGCPDTGYITVSVNALPVVDAGTDVSVCVGQSTGLNATGGINYSWSPAVGLSNSNIPNPVAGPSSNITYTVSGTDANSCSNTDSVRVTVTSLPNVLISPTSPTTVCLGGSVQLMASGGSSYSWAPSGTLSCSTCPDPIAEPINNTTYSVVVTDINGCVNTDSIRVNIGQGNNVVVTPASPEVCLGDSIQLNTSGGVTYSWMPATGLSDPNSPNPQFYPTSTTTYTIQVTDAQGCLSEDTVTVRVNQLITGVFGGDTSVCFGESVGINASGYVQYAWSPGASLNCTNCPSPVSSPTTTTNYTVHAQDVNGCADTGYVTVTVNPLPTVDAGNDTVVCLGQPVNLGATGGVNYSWSPAASLNNPNIPGPLANPSANQVYTVNGVDSRGCSNVDSVLVEILALPNINAGNDKSICIGDTAQLQVNGGIMYTWSPASGLSCLSCPAPSASPLSSVTYSVHGVDASGCENTDTVMVSVRALPTVTTTPSVDEVCNGDSIQITAAGGSTYQWSPGTGLSCVNCPDPIAKPTQNVTYTVIATDVTGCSDEATVAIDVKLPATVNISSDTAVCHGESVILTANGGIQYTWNPPTQTGQSITVTPQVTTTYVVEVIDSNNCIILDSVQVSTYVPANPSAGLDVVICEGDTLELSASNGVNYQWEPSGSVFDPASPNTQASPSVTTIYTVTIIDNNGCINTDDVEVIVNQLPNVDAGPDLTIYVGNQVQLMATGASSYQWSPPNYLSSPSSVTTVAMPDQTITYYVLGTDQNGCSNVDSLTIDVLAYPKLYIPTAFSPNRDGKNDVFSVTNLGDFQEVTLRVYDRWGTLVFESNGINQGWNGRSPDGAPMPIGTYVYIVEAEAALGYPLTRRGNVTLIR